MTNEQKLFIEKVGNAARIYYPEYKILPSLVIAQAIKESGWGKSSLSDKYFNFFGLKWVSGCGCDYVELKTKEYINGKYIVVNAKFRRYYSFNEGIEGYYKFLSGYKRYKNLIGVTDPYTVCKLIQQDGYATSPTYATSLYNDYILRYDLTKYDEPDVVYIRGNVYTTNTDLYIRNAPDGDHKFISELTTDGKMHSKEEPITGYAILKAGTRVTCLDVVNTGTCLWVEIPSGYICGKNSKKTYVT